MKQRDPDTPEQDQLFGRVHLGTGSSLRAHLAEDHVAEMDLGVQYESQQVGHCEGGLAISPGYHCSISVDCPPAQQCGGGSRNQYHGDGCTKYEGVGTHPGEGVDLLQTNLVGVEVEKVEFQQAIGREQSPHASWLPFHMV